MNVFQKILFPFSGPKTQFLENKWWHRLAKVVITIILIVVCIIMYFELSDRIDYVRTPEGRYIENTNKTIDDNVYGDLIISLKAKPDATLEKVRAVFPEFASQSDEVLGGLIDLLKNHPDLTVQEVHNELLRLSVLGMSLGNKIVYYSEYSLEIIGLILLRLFLVYLVSLGLQLAYFKGIVYIVYGNKTK